MNRALGGVGSGCLFALLDLLTIILVLMKLDQAIDLSWLAVTMPTWGPITLFFLYTWLFSHLGSGRRRTTRRRTTRRRAPVRRRRRAW